MSVVLAKANKRKLEEGKETAVYVDGRPVDEKRMERFRERRSTKESLASPSAHTSD
jgi:hypothetical protein